MKGKRVFTLSALLAVIGLFVALLLGSTIGVKTASAEEMMDDVSSYEVSTEIGANEEAEIKTDVAEQTKHTFDARMKEWFSHNFLEFLSSVDFIAILGCILAVCLESKSNNKNAEETNKSIKENTKEIKRNTASNDEVLKVANLIIDSTNSLTTNGEKLDGDVNKLLLLNRAVLEILVSVYVNNKNIPQATKDLVNMKYVNAITGKTEKHNEVKEASEG